MSVKNFENNRWTNEDQKMEFRHKATISMVNEGSVLDLGCGDGFLLSIFKDRGLKVKGLDISEKGIEKSKEKGLDVSIFDFSNKLPFPDNTFDTVIMLDLLEHLYDPESLLKEARRISNKNIIIGVPNFSSIPARMQMLFGRIPENNYPKKGHIYWFNYHILKDMISRNNLKIIELKTNTNFENIPIISNIIRFFADIFPNLFSLSFVIKVSK